MSERWIMYCWKNIFDLKATGLTTKTLLCGCVYEDNEWMLVRVKECEKHFKERHKKVEYRPKAECNRNDTRGE